MAITFFGGVTDLIEDKAKRNIQRFSRRLIELMYEAGIQSEGELAKRLDIHPNTLTRYKKGSNAPDLALLTKICDDFDVSLGWLLDDHEIPIAVERTFQEDERRTSAPSKLKLIDVDLVDHLRYIVSDVFKEAGQRLPPNQATREAAILYNQLLERVSDIFDMEEVKATLPQLRFALKKRLSQSAMEPGTGKQSA